MRYCGRLFKGSRRENGFRWNISQTVVTKTFLNSHDVIYLHAADSVEADRSDKSFIKKLQLAAIS